MKKVLSTIVAATASIPAVMAQSAESTSATIANDPALPIYIAGIAMLLLLILVGIVTIYTIRVLDVLTERANAESAERKGVAYVPPLPWWQRFLEKVNPSVPVEQEDDIALDHSYDGIRELDNHLPPWWTWLFNGSIAFAVVYMIAYHVTESFPLSQDEYKRELALADEAIRKHLASQPQAVFDENTLVYTADAAAIENGKSVYINNACGGCHRDDGGGNTIGPNLADEYWLHGGDIKDIFNTIKNGVVEKGMPAWGKAMSAQDVKDVTFYVMSLQGTHPPDAKAPQGEIFQPAEVASDTLKTQAGL